MHRGLQHAPSMGITMEGVLVVALLDLGRERTQCALADPEVPQQVEGGEHGVHQARELAVRAPDRVEVPAPELLLQQVRVANDEVRAGTHRGVAGVLPRRGGRRRLVLLVRRLVPPLWPCPLRALHRRELHGLVRLARRLERETSSQGARGVDAQAFQKLEVLVIELQIPTLWVALVDGLQNADDLPRAVGALADDGERDERVHLLHAEPALLHTSIPTLVLVHVGHGNDPSVPEATPGDEVGIGVHAALARGGVL
mmetsp:Transcript_52922/g.154198  ORF Transcript_52922/g.154198 Transcript_52922/m.154198 type:complete len:256 (+) Transcript_52922:1434-2201(+)